MGFVATLETDLHKAGMKRMSGITLIEMLVVMTIAAILIGIGAPSFRYVTNSNRMSGEINSLLGDMQFGRSEALKEGQTVTVCSSTDGVTCTKSSWDQGWIVYSDPSAAKSGSSGSTGTNPALRVQKAFLGTDTLTFDNTIQAITFNREGFANEPMAIAAAAVTATLHDKTSNAVWSRCLVVTPGRITTEKRGAANPPTQLTACK
jgi:type IV fimbrial biogenesis protein FimT